MGRERLMYNMTVKEIVEGLKETQTVIIPVGMIEQHGYHLPTSTDVHNSAEIARMTSEATGCFVTPPVHYNISGGMLPGTINITPQVFSLMLMDIMQSLVMQGFKNLIILLGHGGQESGQAARQAADFFQWLRPKMEGVTVSLIGFWDMSPTYTELSRKGDWHAGLLETSLMLYWKPELVKMDQAQYDEGEILGLMRTDPYMFANKIKALDSEFVVPRIVQDPRIEVGVMGDFTGANAELGKRIAEECVSGLSKFIGELEAVQ
jgi:creatinine amidohydrolase